MKLDDGRCLRFRLLRNGLSMSWSDVVGRWQHDPVFCRFFNSVLADSPFPAFFWETPPVTNTTLAAQFEFVIVDSKQLADVSTHESSFANHFASAKPDASVIEFSNLGGDATLVVPCPRAPRLIYSHIGAFVRKAPADQQDQLWQRVGAALEKHLGTQPVWVSTSGLGVYWVHIRLDSAPKYYTYQPYRTGFS